ncbi:MAG: hypothetical protein IKQ00_12805 [Butyrivibrio sp.]|nr:hypothetical protein [Butyrivibrio sp.]
MKVQQNTDVQMSNVQNQDYFSKNNAETPKGKRKEKDNTQSISGADLTGESLVVQRRKIARKQALKVVADAFKGELGIDAQLKSIRDKIHSLKDELAEVKENARDRIKFMMIGFGVDPESEEAKKAMDIADEVMAHHEEYMKYKFPQVVVVEEAEQEQEQEQEQSYDEIVINKVDAEVISDLTEFQKAVVDSLGTVVKAIKNLNDEITQNVLTHKAIKIKRAESLNMLKAQKEAEKIMNTSTREVIEILANEAVNHLEEEEKEREEEAKKAAEEKKEEKKEEARKLEKEAMQQEMIANIREHAELSEKTSADVKKAIARRERTEALLLDPDNVSQKIVIPDATSLEDAQSAVNSAITNILNSNFLVTDDIKGSAVDNQV